MSKIEDWVSAQIDAISPKGGAANAMNRLANACVCLKGKGSGTLFGLQPPDGLVPNEFLYRKACDVLATWFEQGEDGEGEALASFVRLHELDVPIPARFSPPAPPAQPQPATPEQLQAMACRVSQLSPLWEVSEWNLLRGEWDKLVASVVERGGEVHSELEVGGPAIVEELARTQRDLGRELPDDLIRAFLTAKSVSMAFSFPPGFPVDAGGYEEGVWRLDDLPRLYEESQAWALDEEDQIWVEAIPFAGIDGSYLAMWNGAVVFLEHEGDRLGGHGVALAPDFRRFVETWTRCGCPNGGEWQTLKAFVSPDGTLAPESGAAQSLRRMAGVG